MKQAIMKQQTVQQETRKKRLETMDIVALVLMTLITLSILIPFYNSIVISFSTISAYLRNPFAFWPSEGTLENYSIVLKNGIIFTSYKNTILITVVGTVLSMSVSVAAAFVFSRKSFPGKRLFFLMMLFTMFFSGGTIPTYLVIKRLGLIDHRSVIILMCGISTFNIIVMKNGFEQVPDALEEAARIDGANDLQIFFQVLLPLQTAQIATFTLFTAVAYWNEWFWSMLALNSSSKMTLMSYLRAIVMEASGVMEDTAADVEVNSFTMGIKMATVVLTMLPIMCVYPFLQKYFAKGILVGAVKM